MLRSRWHLLVIFRLGSDGGRLTLGRLPRRRLSVPATLLEKSTTAVWSPSPGFLTVTVSALICSTATRWLRDHFFMPALFIVLANAHQLIISVEQRVKFQFLSTTGIPPVCAHLRALTSVHSREGAAPSEPAHPVMSMKAKRHSSITAPSLRNSGRYFMSADLAG